ncbi:MAG: cupin domain-containing protein [Bacteriovoracaceae bacterium]|nr:cupin domain-containing protein [Bacteriovoracaceae bacterium]
MEYGSKKSSEIKHKVPLGKSEQDYPYAWSQKIFHTEQLFFHSEKVKPGKKSSAPHYHKTIDEIIYVVSGKLAAIEGDQRMSLEKGDSICFYANSDKKHYFENLSDSDAEFLIFRRADKKEDVVY